MRCSRGKYSLFSKSGSSSLSNHGFIVRKALWQHVPLRTRVENPQDRLKHFDVSGADFRRPILAGGTS
jgi:hypothetical protein